MITILKLTMMSRHQDVDAPLQSGLVHVFEQPGIEAPSDEDDFIEVSSKRQILNHRCEQIKKEIKAKSRVTKMPRKPRPTSQSTFVSASSNLTAIIMSKHPWDLGVIRNLISRCAMLLAFI
ncbi:hypothetical protein Q3G72_022739 [Acer saccharum]|nr:hypothetical protein Q3G72_022739 [Acer saccharum]